MTDNRNLLAELSRAKALFQARALAAYMGSDPSKVIVDRDGNVRLRIDQEPRP